MASYIGPQQNHLFLNALKKNKTTGTLVIVGVKTLDKYRHGAGLWQIPLTCPRYLSSQSQTIAWGQDLLEQLLLYGQVLP